MNSLKPWHPNSIAREPMRDDSTFWLDLGREEFRAACARRLPTLRARYGSMPVCTHGEIELGVMEKAWRRKKTPERVL